MVTTPNVQRDAGTSVSARVRVTLRAQGSRPPLYFIPAGYADMRAFRRITDLLDNDQPVYGLQPPPAENVKGLRRKPLDWLISSYISGIKAVQPSGPYNLVGYSLGGLFTVETARQLIRNGDTVGLVMVLDPPLRVPLSITLFYLNFQRLCNLTNWLSAFRWWMIRRWKSRLFGWVSDEGLCTHVAVIRQHAVAAYPGRITYVLPHKTWIRWLNLTEFGRSWQKIARGGLEVHHIPGHHFEMLNNQQAGEIASLLSRRLCETGLDSEGTTIQELDPEDSLAGNVSFASPSP